MDPVLFEAVIIPHRSLSPRGMRILIGVICGLCSLTALRFVLIRAWPVIGFSVIEIGLAVLLLWINARRVRETELLLLSESGLEIVRTDASGRKQTVSLPHAWLQVLMEERDGRIPRLLLAARGLRHEIASSLGEAEKRDLAGALSAALHRLHHPIFDNPQLRD